MRRLLVGVLIGFTLGLGSIATAAQTTNFPLQTWLGVQSINRKVGNPAVLPGSGTLTGGISNLQRDVSALNLKVSTLCQLHGRSC